jgi:hypothetical protein
VLPLQAISATSFLKTEERSSLVRDITGDLLQLLILITVWLSFSMICSIIVCCVYNFTARYVLLVFMAAGLWSTNALSLSYASSTFGAMPQETRAVSLALVNAMGNLAQIYGAYLFPSEDAPKYIKGFAVISAMCGFGVVIYAKAHVVLRRYPTKSHN